jgi:peptidylprolyl isomerase
MNRRRAAALAARRRQARRRKLIGAALAVLVVGMVVAVLARGTNRTAVATSSSTTTSGPSTTAAASAAGKPCVARTDPLPAGAPDVPVPVGPPPTSLVSQDLKVGTGAEVTAASTVTVNYVGVSCSTGRIFDSSYKPPVKPSTFPLNQVIAGWQTGLTGMKVGGERLLGVPPEQAYGPTGQPPAIAPDETLWFVIDLLDAKPT